MSREPAQEYTLSEQVRDMENNLAAIRADKVFFNDQLQLHKDQLRHVRQERDEAAAMLRKARRWIANGDKRHKIATFLARIEGGDNAGG